MDGWLYQTVQLEFTESERKVAHLQTIVLIGMPANCSVKT